MKTTCIQMDMLFAQPEENFAKAKRLIRDAMASGPDVVVLPETWNTGFFPKERLSELAERDCARVKRELGGLAAELGVNLVAGSVANVRGGKVYNTACVFDRAGNCVAEYDKTHLFTPMGEHAYFTPGDHLCRFRLDGHDCGLVICYDIRFPELTRTLAVQGMDVLFVVSQWPAARIPHLRALTVARAIENQMFRRLLQFLRRRGRDTLRRLLRNHRPMGRDAGAGRGKRTNFDRGMRDGRAGRNPQLDQCVPRPPPGALSDLTDAPPQRAKPPLCKGSLSAGDHGSPEPTNSFYNVYEYQEERKMEYNFPVTRTTHPKPRPADETKLGFAKYFTDHMFVMDYDEGQGWHDGRVVPHEPFLIEPASCVLHYAQMMFEGMKAYRTPDGGIRIFRPDMNIKRMARTNERMCIPELPGDLFLAAVKAVIGADRDWVPSAPGTAMYIRPFIFGDEVSFSVLPAKHYKFMIILSPTGSYYAANDGGLSTTRIYVQDKYIRAAHGGTGYAKVGGNYGGGMRASQDAMKYNCKDVLWLDAAEHKYVEEIGTSNAFFRIADEVITAPLDSGTILPGITRDSVIQLLKKWGVKVSERKLSIDEVVAASKDGSLQEIFASGTAAVISPIGWLNVMGTDVQVADGTVGPVAQKLYDTLYGMQTGTVADDMGWTYRLL